MSTHDSAYKQLFSHPEMVTDLLRGYVEEEWVAQLDFTTLEQVASSFVSDDYREREDDIIWRVRWSERWLYLYLLIEFQSTVDRFMAVRLMVYVGLLYQDLIQAGRPARNERLPPVLPIVLYNGEERWWARTDLADLMEEQLPTTLAQFQPSLRYLLLDEGCYADHLLPTTKNLASALFGLENSRGPEDLTKVLKRLLEWLHDPAQASLRRSFITWLHRIGLKRYIPEIEFNQIYELQEMHAMLAERLKTWPEQWEQKGMQKGGDHILRHMLQYRFGPNMPDWVEKYLSGASTEQLESWALAAMEESTLEEIFCHDKPEH